MSARERQIQELRAELRLPITAARRKDVLAMLKIAESLARQGR